MKNIHLNAGGVIGGLAGLAVGIVVMILLQAGNDPSEGGAKLTIFGVIGGAFAGNFLWELVFRKKENPDDDRLHVDE
jgi:hypothetical protein